MIRNIEAVNQRFRRAGVIMVNMRWVVLLIIAVITAIAGFGLPKIYFDTSDENLFLPNDPLSLARKEFNAIFGNDQKVLWFQSSPFLLR